MRKRIKAVCVWKDGHRVGEPVISQFRKRQMIEKELLETGWFDIKTERYFTSCFGEKVEVEKSRIPALQAAGQPIFVETHVSTLTPGTPGFTSRIDEILRNPSFFQ